MSIPNLFFKLKKLQCKSPILFSTALWKSKGGNLTAGKIKQQDGLQDILRHDEGFPILKNLRSSPSYFQAKQKELFAIIRQLGMPTFFETFSEKRLKPNG